VSVQCMCKFTWKHINRSVCVRDILISKTHKKSVMCNHTCVNMCIPSVCIYVIDGLHKLGMQAIGIVYVSKHDGAQIYEVKLCTVSKC
jgi:hypothetical protein